MTIHAEFIYESQIEQHPFHAAMPIVDVPAVGPKPEEKPSFDLERNVDALRVAIGQFAPEDQAEIVDDVARYVALRLQGEMPTVTTAQPETAVSAESRWSRIGTKLAEAYYKLDAALGEEEVFPEPGYTYVPSWSTDSALQCRALLEDPRKRVVCAGTPHEVVLTAPSPWEDRVNTFFAQHKTVDSAAQATFQAAERLNAHSEQLALKLEDALVAWLQDPAGVPQVTKATFLSMLRDAREDWVPAIKADIKDLPEGAKALGTQMYADAAITSRLLADAMTIRARQATEYANANPIQARRLMGAAVVGASMLLMASQGIGTPAAERQTVRPATIEQGIEQPAQPVNVVTKRPTDLPFNLDGTR